VHLGVHAAFSLSVVAVEALVVRVGIDDDFLFRHFTAFQKALGELGLRILKKLYFD